MSPPDPTDSREWWRENWQRSESWGTCTRCGVKILNSHLAEGVCRDRAGCDATIDKPEPMSRSFARCDWWCDMCRDRVACESKLKMRPASDPVAIRDRAECDVTLARKPCLWCGEVHETETIRLRDMEVTTCPKLGTQSGVMFALAQEQNPVAVAMSDDGSPVVAFAPEGLEVRPFGREDLDESGMPRWRK